MACSMSGFVCVIKFGKMSSEDDTDNARRRLEQEQKRYEAQDDDIPVRVITLNGRPALLMKHYSPVHLDNADKDTKYQVCFIYFPIIISAHRSPSFGFRFSLFPFRSSFSIFRLH